MPQVAGCWGTAAAAAAATQQTLCLQGLHHLRVATNRTSSAHTLCCDSKLRYSVAVTAVVQQAVMCIVFGPTVCPRCKLGMHMTKNWEHT
jgi:hypothetical protein